MSDLKVNAGELARAMKFAAQVVEKRNTIPILSNVLFEAGSNCLSIVATDLDLQLKQELPASCQTGFAVTIPAQRLTAIANAVPGDAQMTFTPQDGDRIAVKAGRSRWVLATLPRDDFPQIPAPKAEKSLTLEPAPLALLINRVLPFRSTEQTRYYLNGPLWHGEDGKIALAAKGCGAGRAGKAFSREAMFSPRGKLPVMQFCLPDQLEVDPSYQRSIENPESQALIAQIALNWHWGRAQLLTVSRRDGRLFVVDGQHRLAAARLRGDIQQLPCLIEEYTDVAEEAALFNDLNDRRRPVSALDKFRAAVVAGDADCIAIGAAMERAGLTLAPHSNPLFWKPGQLANIGGIRSAWKSHGAAATELALSVLADAFKGQVLTYAGTIFPGLVAVCAGHGGAGVIEDAALSRLIAALGARTQEDWRNDALREMAASGDGRVAAMTNVLRRAMAASVPVAVPAGGNAGVTAQPVADGLLPVVGRSAAFGDAFEKRASGARFCGQCEKLRRPEEAKRCGSAWCKLRDVAA